MSSVHGSAGNGFRVRTDLIFGYVSNNQSHASDFLKIISQHFKFLVHLTCNDYLSYLFEWMDSDITPKYVSICKTLTF